MICPDCKLVPPEPDPDALGVPVRLGGTRHHSWCPRVPKIDAETQERLIEMSRMRQRGEAEARTFVIG